MKAERIPNTLTVVLLSFRFHKKEMLGYEVLTKPINSQKWFHGVTGLKLFFLPET